MPSPTALLLRSPFHRLRSRQRILLHFGDHEAVLPYLREADTITVLGDGADHWWRSMAGQEQTPVTVWLDGAAVSGVARLVSGEALDAALVPYLHAHPSAWSSLGVSPGAGAEDLASAAQQAAVIVIELDAAPDVASNDS